MQVIDIYEAQIRLCGLIEATLAGEQMVIVDAGRFLVKLVPREQGISTSHKPALMPQRDANAASTLSGKYVRSLSSRRLHSAYQQQIRICYIKSI